MALVGRITRRRGDNWQLRVYLGRHPVTGKQLIKTRSFTGREREAQAAANRFAAELEDAGADDLSLLGEATDDDVSDRDGTLGGLLEEWYRVRTTSPDEEENFSASTASTYRQYLDGYLRPLLGVPVSRLKARQIRDFYTGLRLSGGRGGQPLAATTAYRVHGMLHAAWEYAIATKVVFHNPTTEAWFGPQGLGKKGRKVPKGASRRVPEAADVARFLAALAEDPVALALLSVEAHTGVRRGELTGLREDDVDVAHAEMVIRHVVVAGPKGAGLIDQPRTKTGAERVVPLAPETLAVITRHLLGARQAALAAGVIRDANPYLFSPEAAGSRPYWPSSLSRKVRLAATKAGVGVIRLQELRCFQDSVLCESGADLAVFTERLGHSAGVAVTNYLKATKVAKKKAASMAVDAIAAAS